LQSAGISSPKAVMVMYTGDEKSIEAVQRIRLAFPAVRPGYVFNIQMKLHIFIYASVYLFFILCKYFILFHDGKDKLHRTPLSFSS
jgi:hypothetical protein